jgi:hypothetical protein
MRTISLLVFAACLQVTPLRSQVLAPVEIKDEGARDLQQKYFVNLKTIANEVNRHAFPYRFYFSRTLDVSEHQELSSDQRSIQFDRFQGKLILKATGNYFASYSAESMDTEQRVRQTFNDVMMPILRAAVTQFHDSDVPDSYALEISHHVRKNVLGVLTEGAENVVIVLPKRSAIDLVAASDVAHQNAALLKAAAFLDGKPLTFWPTEDSNVAANPEEKVVVNNPPSPVPSTSRPVEATTKDVPPAEANQILEKLQQQNRRDLDRMVRELDAQAHFVTYAAPAFIEFHKGRYLQLSVVTTLPDRSEGSQYQLAALAFDKHITHLIRPVISYLKNQQDFDGIDFSATIRVGSGSDSASALAVEYVFPLKELIRYEGYDCTGQQLLDASFILINGERVGLNLQSAETDSGGRGVSSKGSKL